MSSKVKRTRLLVGLGAAIALITALACGSAEQVATPVPASEIGAMVRDAVSASMPAAQPAGPTAAEIQGMVSSAVTGAMPSGTSAAEMESMVRAAVAATSQPGITRAEMEAAVSRSVQAAAGDQLTAADVQQIVGASLRALPAPKIDTASLRPLVTAAVASAVPEGVSAAEITKLVEAAVNSATAGALTQGEMEAAVARSVQAASGGQLTAAQVQGIVKASLAATEQAITATGAKVDAAAAAAMAAQKAAEAAGSEAKAATKASEAAQMQAAEAQMAAEAAQAAPSQVFKYEPPDQCPGCAPASRTYTGPLPTTFKESPMSAALVKQGKILPLAQRLPVPEDILYMHAMDEIGVYGGTQRFMQNGSRGGPPISDVAIRDGIEEDLDSVTIGPSVFHGLQASEDGREYTLKIRRGSRWNDGYPFTMENVRFATEDLLLNKELMPGLPGAFRSPISGNDISFEFIDDGTFKVIFDDPNWRFEESTDVTIFSGQKGCPRCMFAPGHVYKRYHIKYNAAEIPALMEKFEQPTWTKLFTTIRNTRGYLMIPSEQIPTNDDPSYIYKGDHYIPYQAGWLKDVLASEGTGAHYTRNHYFFGADPEGNQLPYIDHMQLHPLESREVAAFRMMAGEIDYARCCMVLGEMPLYLQNMTKGDYSVFNWAMSGNDISLQINQEFNVEEQKEIGQLLRTLDFRRAISAAMDRNAMNETAAAGLGTVQNWMPARKDPYYPGDQYRLIHTAHDLDIAKANMTKLGYATDTAMRKDGTGQLTLFMQTRESNFPYLELLQSQVGDIGIAMDIKEGTAHQGIRSKPPTEYFDFRGASEGGTNPWSNTWNMLAPTSAADHIAGAIGQYFATRGEQGMAPTGGDAAFTDAYGTMAPDGTYPADVGNTLLKMQTWWDEGLVNSQYSPKRIELAKNLYRINAEEANNKLTIIGWGFTRGLVTKRNNFRNVPRLSFGVRGWNESYYFEDGTDNMTNPGNKSVLYQSCSQFDQIYWFGCPK